MNLKTAFSGIIAGIIISFSTSYSQEIFEGEFAHKLFPGTSVVRTSNYSEIPSFIRFQEQAQPDEDEIFSWISKNFRIEPEMKFIEKSSFHDELGYEHIKFQQVYNGILVEDAIWILHIRNGKVVSMNGLLYTSMPSSPAFGLTESAALQKALDFVGADSYKWEIEQEEQHLKTEKNDPAATYFPAAEKLFLSSNSSFEKTSYRTAYRFNIYAHSELYRAFIYVDANSGEILLEEEIIHHVNTPGTAVTSYSGTQTIISDSFSGSYRLRETTRGDGVNTYDMNQGTSYGASVDFTDADNNWNNVNAQLDQYATDAHWGAEMTYDYFFYQHGRNSIDDAGFALNSYVHYDVNYDNAFWDGSRMTYGDGDGSSFDPLTSIDIAGHEISHGLTTFTADLNYSAESGALNESFSDIFGTSIENYARPSNWNWTMGEDIGGAFRSM